MQKDTDIIVVGSGLAGLTIALKTADSGFKVAIVTKDRLDENSSYYAQGGIAAVWSMEDSFATHVEDTLRTGVDLCDQKVVDAVVKQGPKSVQWLIDNGVYFSKRIESPEHQSEFHLTKEGGHSKRRVIHSADATGKSVETTLISLVEKHPNIEVLENFLAIELITAKKLHYSAENRCLGLYALNVSSGAVSTLSAKFTVLATGGASKAYLYTSNPDTSTGDGIAMAWRAGCRVSNMEFVQFHPTCLYHPHAKSFLVTEAVRGEGGKLILENGDEFMHKYDPSSELAPRDIVARAIDHEMKTGGYDCVFLDISFKSSAFVHQHFPNVYQRCMSFGIDMTKQPIPVVPAAHYTCGGVVVDLHGRTDVPGLYAIGESACTGLHGANRLASNSLLECLVYADAAFQHILEDSTSYPEHVAVASLPNWDESLVTDPDEMIVISHNWDELRRSMWDYVGIVRTEKRLRRALHRIDMLTEEVGEFYSQFKISRDLIELRNLLQVAELIVRCALRRKESRGLHYLLDYPEIRSEYEVDTVLNPNDLY